ncbi:MAG: hydrogenase maturation nickel metallochaperone HypA [Candidatus Omnitrophota bacterium]
MHEGVFTEQIVEAILAQVKKDSLGKPKRIKVNVGEVFHLQKDSVLMHYQILTQNTDLCGVDLDLTEETVRVLCNGCQKEGPVEDHHLLMCSYCDSRDVKMISGDRISIESIEV